MLKNRLTELRKAAGLTLDDLADALNVDPARLIGENDQTPPSRMDVDTLGYIPEIDVRVGAGGGDQRQSCEIAGFRG